MTVTTPRIPCMSWTCTREHEILRTGPVFASYHVVDERKPAATEQTPHDPHLCGQCAEEEETR